MRPRNRLRRRRSSRPLLAAVACLLAGCGVLSLEEQILQRFFEASRLYDRVALEKVAAPGIVFNPVTDGVVEDFTVTSTTADGSRRLVDLDVEVSTASASARRSLRVVIADLDGTWRITDLRPLPASRTAP